MTCARRVESATTTTGSGGRETSRWCRRESMRGRCAFDGRFDDAGQVHGFLPEIDLAPGDPADIQEVVDQPHEVGHLAVDHLARTDQSAGRSGWRT